MDYTLKWHDMILPPINLWSMAKNLEKIERDTPTARRGGRGERGAFFHRICTGNSQATPQSFPQSYRHPTERLRVKHHGRCLEIQGELIERGLLQS